MCRSLQTFRRVAGLCFFCFRFVFVFIFIFCSTDCLESFSQRWEESLPVFHRRAVTTHANHARKLSLRGGTHLDAEMLRSQSLGPRATSAGSFPAEPTDSNQKCQHWFTDIGQPQLFLHILYGRSVGRWKPANSTHSAKQKGESRAKLPGDSDWNLAAWCKLWVASPQDWGIAIRLSI